MTRAEQLNFLIRYLSPQTTIPKTDDEKWRLFRSLVNMREPLPVSDKFLSVQDKLLQGEINTKGITSLVELVPIKDNLYLWQGDITTLAVDGIVNAANNQMLGCFIPCHRCIDNAIHTYAGVQLRFECAEIMRRQGYAEPTGKAKITSAYNLPSKYILHTVGPIIYDKLTDEDCGLLANCYTSCLNLARENGLKSIAFCCISTGEFHFPNEQAAGIALATVGEWQKQNSDYAGDLAVIFNVFKDEDYEIYQRLLR